MHRLHISEHFGPTLQGEGNTVGMPAIFWRFKGCVLTCSYCDTIEVWKKGISYTFDEAYRMFADAGYFTRLNKHECVLVLTGGDPLLQQGAILEFFYHCISRGESVGDWRIEVENQGSLMPGRDFSHFIQQWNISPKLSNSGVPRARRIVPEVIEFLKRQRAYFKFPISSHKDLAEVQEYLEMFNIPKSRVSLMPICSTREEHVRVGAIVADLCKNSGYRFSPRLQLVLWDKTCGV
jgi:organic radical activating enzyme